jgi:predicted Zn-dependent peptidase
MSSRFRKLTLPLFILAVFCLLAGSAALAETLEEKVKEFELDNGMKFLVVEREEAPVVFCAIVFDVGSANEWPNVTGISHLLEHMMFKGTKMMGTKNYKKEKKYIEETDKLGNRTIELRKEMGQWRFKIFTDFYNDVYTSLPAERKDEIGPDKLKQAKAIAEKIEHMDALPDSLISKRYLIEEEGKNYLDLFLDYKLARGEIYQLLDEQREYVIDNEMWKTYQKNGANFLNAGTSYDFTVYFVYLPANRLELWMTMESDRMDTPVFREFWSERDVVMEERRLGENDPDDVLSEAFYSVAFKACPYKWPVVGWMSDIRTIDRQELKAYHQKYYSPNNATAVVVGDVDFDEVKDMAEDYFESIPSHQPPPPIETREPEQQGERRVKVEHTANPKLMIGYHKPVYPHPDALTFRVMSFIVGQGRTSRLYKTVYEEKELTAQPPRVYEGPGNRYDNLFIITAEPRKPHTLEEVEEAIYQELEKLKTEPVTDRELQRIKNQIYAQRIQQLGSNLGISFQLLMGEIFFGDYREIFEMYEKIQEVTKKDIMEAANEYLVEKSRTVAHRIKSDEQAPDEEEAGGVEAEMQAHRQEIMMFVQSLSQEEQQEIMKKMQSMRSKDEAMEFFKSIYERAKAAGFIKEESKEEKKD